MSSFSFFSPFFSRPGSSCLFFPLTILSFTLILSSRFLSLIPFRISCQALLVMRRVSCPSIVINCLFRQSFHILTLSCLSCPTCELLLQHKSRCQSLVFPFCLCSSYSSSRLYYFSLMSMTSGVKSLVLRESQFILTRTTLDVEHALL